MANESEKEETEISEGQMDDPTTEDEEMAKLLQLYGIRKTEGSGRGGRGEESGEKIPSVADSWASRYLRERRAKGTEQKRGMELLAEEMEVERNRGRSEQQRREETEGQRGDTKEEFRQVQTNKQTNKCQ